MQVVQKDRCLRQQRRLSIGARRILRPQKLELPDGAQQRCVLVENAALFSQQTSHHIHRLRRLRISWVAVVHGAIGVQDVLVPAERARRFRLRLKRVAQFLRACKGRECVRRRRTVPVRSHR